MTFEAPTGGNPWGSEYVTAMAGDRPGYEEALRALYRDDAARFCELIAAWPKDVCRYTADLLEGGR